MADHPLRPATDHRLGRPLPHQLANRTQAPPKATRAFDPQVSCGISSSLPPLSPTHGQIPTRYSPVRHCRVAPTVRLACVKHAASVRSEPGSNSQVHHVPRCRGTKRTNPASLNQAPLGPWCGAPETISHKRNCNASIKDTSRQHPREHRNQSRQSS